MRELILIGGGGHCRSCIDVVEQAGNFIIKGIIDSNLPTGEKVLGYKVIGGDDTIEDFKQTGVSFLITVGQIKSPAVRIKLHKMLAKNALSCATIISPLAYVSKYASIGDGTIVMHHAVINAGAQVGKNCIINTKSLIEHDAIVGDHCHISTAAIINGGVQIGEGSFIGSNATTKQHINIIPGSFVRANEVMKG